jgi:hypothetical protein
LRRDFRPDLSDLPPSMIRLLDEMRRQESSAADRDRR